MARGTRLVFSEAVECEKQERDTGFFASLRMTDVVVPFKELADLAVEDDVVALEPPAGSGSGLGEEGLAAVEVGGAVGVILLFAAFERGDDEAGDRDGGHAGAMGLLDAPDGPVGEVDGAGEGDEGDGGSG